MAGTVMLLVIMLINKFRESFERVYSFKTEGTMFRKNL